MATAARRPAAMASTTVAGPVSQSPPAKTPSLLVSSVSLSASMVPQGVRVADLGQIVCVDLLAQGQDHRVGGHCELRPGDRLRSPAAAVVRLTQDHLLADHLEDPAVLLRDRNR